MPRVTDGFDTLRTPQDKLCAGVCGAICCFVGLLIIILVPVAGVKGGGAAGTIIAGVAVLGASIAWFYNLCFRPSNRIDSVDEFNRQVYGEGQSSPSYLYPPPPRQPAPPPTPPPQ